MVVPLVSHIDAILSKLVRVRKGSHRSRRDVRSLHACLDERLREELDNRATELRLEPLLLEILANPSRGNSLPSRIMNAGA